jgi:hypothetical protein
VPEDWKGKVMIDSSFIGPDGKSQSGHESPESRAVATFLPHREWNEDEVLELAESTLGIECTGAETVQFEVDDAISMELDHLLLADGAEFQVWARTTIVFDYYQCPISLDQDQVGNVLANYKYGGLSAVDAYFESKDAEADAEDQPLPISAMKEHFASIHSEKQTSESKPEGSESLAANSPSDDHIDSALENGDGDE